jgi:cytochrome c556
MFSKKCLLFAFGALALGGAIVAQVPFANAQNAPGAGRKAVDERKAVYTLIGASFRSFGAVLKGEAQYDAADAKKRLARLAVLVPYTAEVFPDSSNLGEPDTKAKPEVWSHRSDFDAKQKEFIVDVAALVAVNDKDQAFSEDVKTALTKAAQDCKGCHDDFKLK